MTRSILLVDDEPLVRQTVGRVLSRAGWEVRVAGHADEAFAMLEQGPVEAAVVDYDLGDHDGLQVLGRIRDRSPGSVRVLMTGHDDLPMVVAAVNRGEAFKILRKPFRPAALLELLAAGRSGLDAVARASVEASRGELVAEREQLAEALRPDALGFAVQPITEVSTGRVHGNEVLLRPRHPMFPGPAQLLEAVARHERIPELGRVLIARLVDVLPTLEGKLFVNLHPAQLANVDDLMVAVQPLIPVSAYVVFEITEQSSLLEAADWLASVEALRAEGFALAVDDLGAGYSALAMLADVQPDYIKLDRSLITALHTSPRRRRLVQLLATFGHATDARVIAEGIEEPEELEAVRSTGVDLVQGYLLGVPNLI